MIIGLSIGQPAVLLMIVIVGVLASGAGSDRDDPNEMAEEFLGAMASGDADAVREYLCDGVEIAIPFTLEEIVGIGSDVRLNEPLEPHYDPIAGGGAMAALKGTAASGPIDGEIGGTIWVDQPEEDGPWCVSEFRISGTL